MLILCRSDFSMEIRDARPEQLFLFRAITAAIAEGENMPWLADPVSGPEDDETLALREDWENFVRPDLMASSQREVEILIEDLARAEPMGSGGKTREEHEPPEDNQGDGDDAADDDDLFFATQAPGFRILIPADHVEAWYGALNQARLAIESRHSFSNRRPEPSEIDDLPPESRLAFWQWMLFAATQEALLGCLEAKFESGS